MEETKVYGRINKKEKQDELRIKSFEKINRLLETCEEIKIIYLRVSTQYDQEELLQLPKILEEFNLKKEECLLIRSRESAYNFSKDNSRLFNVVKEIVEHEDFEGIKKNIYVWNLNRIYRNREKLVEFGLNAQKHDTLIYSVRQKILSECLKYDGMIRDMLYYFTLQMYGQSAQDESENRSHDVKKAIVYKHGRPYSRKGKMLGRAIRDLNGKKVKMNWKQKDSLELNILKAMAKGYTYTQICKLYAEKLNLNITRTYLASLRQKYLKSEEAKKNYEELKRRRSEES